MPFFSRFKSKGAQPAFKTKVEAEHSNGHVVTPTKPRYQSQWSSKEVVPEEVFELIHICTAEMKSRAEALDAPFLLLPFRPGSDPQGARSFIQSFFKSNAEGSSQYRGTNLQQELRLTEAIVLCSILKWCWSRMPNGVVTWPAYEGFAMGEKESMMARNAFHTFIPIGAASEARRSIIFDFFDLMAAVAAHGKTNGLGGRKLSRLAGWWAFDHTDDGNGFQGGYKSWRAAADACSHLFFAYLRSLSPDTDPSLTVIERIPRSLQALLASTEYPPEPPALLQRSTPRVLMLVDTVSPGPFALLRRAKHFEYRANDEVLREYQEFDDPIEALTDECKRVLYAITTTNTTAAKSRAGGNSKPDEAWSAFSSLGFSDLDERALAKRSPNGFNGTAKPLVSGLRSEPHSRNFDGDRPTTPSWADFLSSGFQDDDNNQSPALLYPPAQVLPPLGSRTHTPTTIDVGEIDDLSPGELAAIDNILLDDAFWWVWITSLASEEPSERKAVFGRCALIETNIMNGRWLIMEEQVKGASPDPAEGAYIAPKKTGLFKFTKRGRLGRKKSTHQQPLSQQAQQMALSATPSKTSIAPDQHAKIRAAAAALTQKRDTPDADTMSRRGRHDEAYSTKTNSMLTLGLQSEAAPAMQWTTAYDKGTVTANDKGTLRAQYLGDSSLGRGKSREELRKQHSVDLQASRDSIAPEDSISAVGASALPPTNANRDLPAPPVEEEHAGAGGQEPILDPISQVPEMEEPVARSSPPRESGANGYALEPRLSQPATVPGSTLPDSYDSLPKDVSVDAPSSPRSDKPGRKPVPRSDNIQDHPAFRQPAAKQSEAKPATPVQSAAALAAQRAMNVKSTSPESVKSQNKLKKQGGTTGGLKKLFGKKKDTTATRGDSFEVARPAVSSLPSAAERDSSRRISMMRKKHEPALPQNGHAVPPAHVQPEPTAPADAFIAPQAQAEHALSRSDLSEHENATREFSRFDQGPMEDMPAAEPAFERNPSPQPEHQHDFHTAAAKRLAPASTPGFEREEFATPMERPNPVDHHYHHHDVLDDKASETTMDGDEHRDTGVVQDRWATIRENAARRAATRPSPDEEEQQSRPSQSQRTDDGETSGEETIESRVARIKARVAELTGNIDTHR